MLFSTIFTAALVASASAMRLVARQDLPACTTTCISAADTTGCASTDQTCLCGSAAFVDSASKCFQTTCSADDLGTAVSVAQQMCAAVGVQVTVSLSASDSATPSISTSTPTASTAASEPSVTDSADASTPSTTAADDANSAASLSFSIGAAPLVVLAVFVIL